MLGFVLGLLCCSFLWGAVGSCPITGVCLYANGRAQITRTATVEGNGEIRFSVPSDALNLIMGTITIQDSSGGQFGGISWLTPTSSTPGRAKPATSSSSPHESGLGGVLNRYSGAELEIRSGERTLRGRLVGVEPAGTGDPDAPPATLTLLSEERNLIPIPLPQVQSIRFLDPLLQDAYRREMERTVSQIVRSRCEIVLQTLGNGRRTVTVNYQVRLPVWKTTCRLVLLGNRAQYESWATVYNDSGEDWNPVQLAFSPIQPQLKESDMLTPRTPERSTLPAALPRDPLAPGRGQDSREGADQPGDMQWILDRMKEVSKERSSQPDLAFRSEKPVRIPDGESLLLPLSSMEVPVQKVILGEVRQDPSILRALRVQNPSRNLLMGGLTTVYEDGTFLGEGWLPSIATGEHGLMGFSQASGFRAVPELVRETRTPARASLVSNGVRIFNNRRKSYRQLLVNATQTSADMVIRIGVIDPKAQLTGDGTLLDADPQSRLMSFPLRADETRTVSFTLTEMEPDSELIPWDELEQEQIQTIQRESLLSREDAASFNQRLAFQKEKEDRTEALDDLKQKLSQTEARLTRQRENLRALGTSAEAASLREQYVRKMLEDESLLTNLQARFAEVQDSIRKLEKGIQELDSARNMGGVK